MNYMPKEPPREMNREPSHLVKALAWLKNVALSNWPLKLLSLVLALVLGSCGVTAFFMNQHWEKEINGG